MTSRARGLRGNATDAETRLWHALRRDQIHDLHFRRQHPIGLYTLDFYCPSLKLAVEVDGGQHAEQRKQADERRVRWLANSGIVVIRYWNNDVLQNLEGVLTDLLTKIEQRVTPSPTLPLSGGGSGKAVTVSSRKGSAP
jgi:very-short-patch-repair endonuclease